MAAHRRWILAVVVVLYALMLSACVGSSGEQVLVAGAPGATLTGKRTVWGPVSLILPKGFIVYKSSGRPGTGGTYGATDDPTARLTWLGVIDSGELKPEFNAKAQAKRDVEKARIVATKGVVGLKQTRLAGADDAWTLDYETASPADLTQQTHLRQIYADLGDRFLLILGQAPADGFEGGDVAASLASVRIES
jgi:hypothetical protein